MARKSHANLTPEGLLTEVLRTRSGMVLDSRFDRPGLHGADKMITAWSETRSNAPTTVAGCAIVARLANPTACGKRAP